MTRLGRRGHSPAFRARVVEAILAGEQHRVVARLYKVSTGSIHIWCRAAGLKPSKGRPPVCHPDREAFGKGYCATCYKRLWRLNGHVEKAE